jgi:hypothetical protein
MATNIGIEIHTGDPGRPYKSLGSIQARVGAATALSKTPTLEDVNFKLQEVAASKGANGVINVTYDRGVSLMSWKALTARGEAVIFESDERACPECAETIKMAAVKCRFCGASL